MEMMLDEANEAKGVLGACPGAGEYDGGGGVGGTVTCLSSQECGHELSFTMARCDRHVVVPRNLTRR